MRKIALASSLLVMPTQAAPITALTFSGGNASNNSFTWGWSFSTSQSLNLVSPNSANNFSFPADRRPLDVFWELCTRSVGRAS